MISALAKVAEIVIAVVAIWIAIGLGHNEQERERQLHTLTVYDTFRSSGANQRLTDFAGEVILEFFETGAPLRDVYSKLSQGKSLEIRIAILAFVRAQDPIYACGWGSSVAITCDTDLLLDLYLDELTWTFFPIRTGIYCDEAVVRAFGGDVDNPDSAIYRLETMIIDYMKRTSPSNITVVRDNADVQPDSGQLFVELRPNCESAA